MRARTRATGFTLTELVLVTVVVSILFGVAVTSLGGLAAARQDVAATRVRNALVFAQEWARGSNNDTWVAFDTTSELLSVFVENPGSPGKANRLALSDPLTRSAMTLQLGEGVGIGSASFGGTAEVLFDQSGSPRDANGTLLVVDGTVGLSGGRTVRVTRNTGLVTID